MPECLPSLGKRAGPNNPNWKGDLRKSKSQIRKDWYHKRKNDPDFKEKASIFRKEHPEYFKKKREESRLWKQNNPVMNIWSNAKYRAKKVGLEFNLDPTDIVIPEVCPYLGVTLTSEKLRGHLESHMSLDRVDSTKGYIKGNVEVISYKANVMKQDASKEQLIQFARGILEKYGEK